MKKWFKKQNKKTKKILLTLAIILLVASYLIFAIIPSENPINYLFANTFVLGLVFTILFSVWMKDKKTKSSDTSVYENSNLYNKNGHVSCHEIIGLMDNAKSIMNDFYAFDTETTGLNRTHDRIIEIGVVHFVDGRPKESFNSLIKTGVPNSPSAQSINKITPEMISQAPIETDVYKELTIFMSDVLKGEKVLVAHNASFDIGFLKNTLSRLGYEGQISFFDNLSFSRKYLYGLDNYKQPTLAKYFKIENKNEHRAKDDAEVCGKVFLKIIHLESETLL